MLTARQITSKYGVTTKSLNDWRKKGIINFKKVNSRFFLYDESFFELNKSELELKEFCKIYHEIKSGDILYESIDSNILDKMSDEQLSILKNLNS